MTIGNKGRLFGQNMCSYMDKQNMSVQHLADTLGYTENEIYQIIDARLYIDNKEKQDIARALNVTLEELLTDNDEVYLRQNAYMECRGEFSNNKNKNLILDLFDAYCDIQEILGHERKMGEL